MQEFIQDGPQLGNQFLEDGLLRRFLAHRLPREILEEIRPGLEQLGQRVVGDIQAMGDAAEAQPPVHVPFDPWGRRIDEVRVSDAWKQLERVSAEEGLIAHGYTRAHGEWSRLHQFVRLYLFAPASAVYTCPLAMTDGAARALELYGDEALKAGPLTRLTSRDPEKFWTSGQWMTERTGGSDVGSSATIARMEDGGFHLYGTKWFTSATTSQMAMALARIEGAPPGSRGLSLFYLELRDEGGRLRRIQIHRLKDKLGTRAVPTAELSLEGTPATLVGGEGHGVRKIATLFNITRIYNAVCSVAGMRRGIALARDFARRRHAFGRPLSEHPLHVETLASLQLELEAALHLTFQVVHLLGREETGTGTDEESALLRLLTPILKLYTARQAVAVASEVLECFGGAGYVEDTGLPRLMRDAQVLSIWEGTTNVLSLDLLRAITRERALPPFVRDLQGRLERIVASPLAASRQRVEKALAQVQGHLEHFAYDPVGIETGARRLAYALARLYAGGLLLEHAQWSLEHVAGSASLQALAAAERWCSRNLVPLKDTGPKWQSASRLLGLEG